MKPDVFTIPLDLGSELIIDNFAGGGGTSTGLEAAFGRPVDIAINHDPEALAMHAMNHPYTRHLCESVWDVDPIKVTNNQPVGLVWLSPDCKHFSKAKGGKPVEKKIRGLAWVTLRWAAKCKPRVIMLENVEEFKTWGPLMQDEKGDWKPDPAKRGKTFASFVRQLEGHGYKVDYRELRACDHDTPTIRKRFFLVARRDGLPILWPHATHGAPDSPGVRAGKLKPYRTAAECIDWSMPCPSIFDRKKPLAEATLRRIAKGIMRYVVDAEQPFIVTNTTGHPGAPVGEPLRTVTTGGHHALVAPSIVPVTHQGGDRSERINEPFRTITGAQRGEKALAAATLVQVGYGERQPYWRCKHCATEFDMEPVCGCTACGHEDDLIKIAGQAPRVLDIEKPLGTVVGSASKVAAVTAFLSEHANASNQRNMHADEPLRTICAQVKGGHFSVVSAALVGVGGRAGDSRPRGADEPTATITAKGDTALVSAVLVDTAHSDISPTGVKRWGQGHKDIADPLSTVSASGNSALATAFLAKHYTGVVGSDLDDPIGTVTAQDHHSLVTSNLIKMRGTSDAAATDEPLGTISAQGTHHAEVRAFLLSYYGSETETDKPESPLRTVTSRERFGLVTIHGQDYQIVDIGLRMLAPRELYRAQGFPEGYVIDEIPDPSKLFVDGHQTTEWPLTLPRIPLTKSAQVRMCGNSVCPPLSEALIVANFSHERQLQGAAA